MSTASAAGRPMRWWWGQARYIIAVAAGITVLVAAVSVQHRQSFEVNDKYVDVPYIPIRYADLPAHEFSTALLDQNWLKVERYLAPDVSDRDYLASFKLNPMVKNIVGSDCHASDIENVEVLPTASQSTEFPIAVQMRKMCQSGGGKEFNRVTFRISPKGNEWYYVAGTIGLQRP